jgi:hypothetical protein
MTKIIYNLNLFQKAVILKGALEKVGYRPLFLLI